MIVKYPAPLRTGSTVAISAFSAGIAEQHEARYQLALDYLRSQGLQVIEGQCLRGQEKHVSAPLQQRVDELMAFLLDDGMDAIFPPWGGELAMELLPLVDFSALESVRPKWILGFSDISTLAAVFTSRLGWASGHCSNLMDLTPFCSDPLTADTLHYFATPVGGSFFQSASSMHSRTWPDIVQDPKASLQEESPTCWRWLGQAPLSGVLQGRLIGGCWDTLSHLFATAYLDLDTLAASCSDGLLLYLENAEMRPTELARTLLSMKFRGVFNTIEGLLLGRCAVKDPDPGQDLTYQEVLEKHLGDLDIPVMIDLDIGHVPPNLTLINGALAKVGLDAQGRGFIEQYLR